MTNSVRFVLTAMEKCYWFEILSLMLCLFVLGRCAAFPEFRDLENKDPQGVPELLSSPVEDIRLSELKSLISFLERAEEREEEELFVLGSLAADLTLKCSNMMGSKDMSVQNWCRIINNMCQVKPAIHDNAGVKDQQLEQKLAVPGREKKWDDFSACEIYCNQHNAAHLIHACRQSCR